MIYIAPKSEWTESGRFNGNKYITTKYKYKYKYLGSKYKYKYKYFTCKYKY